MKNSVRQMIGSVLVSFFGASLCVLQAQQSGNATAEQNHKFQPQLVMKPVTVINPPARGSVTTILRGTELAPNASGQAKLKMGNVEVTVEAQANGLAPPGSLGTQFETYVAWAITPAGKVFKLGAMKVKRNRFEFNTKTVVRSFAIVITAEPYLQVTRPGDTLVLQPPAGAQTRDAKCEFLKGGYAPVGYLFQPLDTGVGYPPQITQMYNARRIATLAGAEQNHNFKMGDERFNYIVFYAERQKKFTDLMLQEAVVATEYFEAARMQAVQPLIDEQMR